MKKGLFFVLFAILFVSLPAFAADIKPRLGFAWVTPEVMESGNIEISNELVAKYCVSGNCEFLELTIKHPKPGESVLLIVTDDFPDEEDPEYPTYLRVRDFNINSFLLIAERPASFLGISEEIKWSKPLLFYDKNDPAKVASMK